MSLWGRSTYFKPNFSINFSRKTYSTLSYALLMSSFRAIKPVFPFLLFFRWWKVSKATRILFEISLSDMKAFCVSKTSLGRIFFNWFAMVWETILYRTLQRLMGLKSLTFSGDFVFKMREMKVWFRFSSMFTWIEKRESGYNDILPNKIPIRLIKNWWHTIRSRCW